VQQSSFREIRDEDRDLIVGGATSSGKTEAVFFPLITAAEKRRGGVSILCISPTRALINDQDRRLRGIVANIDVPIHKWHGESSTSGKNKLIREPRGIVLMTPESLEGRFIRQPLLVRRLFGGLDAVVIDELHHFLCGPRGHQLACLLARLDAIASRPIRKIGITATLGDIGYARKWLSPRNPEAVQLIDEAVPGIRFLSSIRGHEAPVAKDPPKGRRRLQAQQRATLESIAALLFETHRAGTHLVFAGSKRNAEMLCADLKARASSASIEDRFHVHHGSMGRSERERLEQRLRDGIPSTVVTTTTLELGIDIGTVDSIEHVGAPRSLSALRQRVGRSGRRSNPAMLRIHVTEEPLAHALSMLDRLRLNSVRAIAALNLLEKRFIEPPASDGTMLSVVLQQTLSYVRQNVGATLSELTRLIRSATPFQRLSAQSYRELVGELSSEGIGLLRLTPEGRCQLTERAEKLFESKEIYAAFQTTISWEVWSRNEEIGHLLRAMPVDVGDEFRLAGKPWKAIAVNPLKSRITVEPSTSGAAPYFNISSEDEVHPALAAEMRRVLRETAVPPDCDEVSLMFLMQGRAAYHEAGLEDRILVDQPDQEVCHLFTWKGTRFNSVLALLLRFKRLACEYNDVAVSVSCTDVRYVREALDTDLPTIEELSQFLEGLRAGKFDKWVPERLLREDWAMRHAEFEPELLRFCRSVR
jgi:ATP-dependent Lhr-like helicase